MMNQTSIVQPIYLERNAYVYLRQSSPGQVKKNKEGKERQLAMRQVVERLGWPSAQITLLDGDSVPLPRCLMTSNKFRASISFT